MHTKDQDHGPGARRFIGRVVPPDVGRFPLAGAGRAPGSRTRREAPVLRKLIAANELLACAVWVTEIALGKVQAPHDTPGFVELGIEILLFGAALAGGILLWRDDACGVRLSVAVQACQALRLASSRLTFGVACGLQASCDYAPLAPKGAPRTNVFAGYAGVEVTLAGVSPLWIGVNAIAVLCLVWLARDLRARRRREGRAGTPAVVLAVAPVVVGLSVSFLISPPPWTVFDEGDWGGAVYYDASFGGREGGGELALAGPGGDKLPIVTGHASSGSRSGLLQWRTPGPAAGWFMFVSSPGWQPVDASAHAALALAVNAPAAIDAAKLPLIGLQSLSNATSGAVALAAVLPSGIDADPATWQKVTIPLATFKPKGEFKLSELGSIWFRPSAPDDTQRTLWFDDVKLIRR